MSRNLHTNTDNKIAVIIATKGRCNILRELLPTIENQSLKPDHIFIVGSEPKDIEDIPYNPDHLTLHVGRVGSTKQRNDALALAGDQFKYIVFFDDDFIPSHFWLERMVDLFEANPNAASLTGTVLADGICGAGITMVEGTKIISADDLLYLRTNNLFNVNRPYGCNMAFRYSAIKDLYFDERLPLYAWMEDADFGGRVAKNGHIMKAECLRGVHLGHKVGRTSGVKLGYSQIANAVYIGKKSTLPLGFVVDRAIKNVLMNTIRSFKPEPYIDRRGRLKGNLIAIADIFLGRIAPERIMDIN